MTGREWLQKARGSQPDLHMCSDSDSDTDSSGKVVPCALATALDIGLSNLSLKTITLTFYSTY